MAQKTSSRPSRMRMKESAELSKLDRQPVSGKFAPRFTRKVARNRWEVTLLIPQTRCPAHLNAGVNGVECVERHTLRVIFYCIRQALPGTKI